MRILENTVMIIRDLNEAYGRNSDQFEGITARAGARVGFAHMAKGRIDRAFTEPENVVDMIILHHTSQFAVY